MESVLKVPNLYADHHVLKVREILGQIAGVEEVYASAAFKKVRVSFDPGETSAEALEQALEQAGYGSGEHIYCVDPPASKEDGSFWHTARPRETDTNALDIEMSGDFRKY
ncbi:MAG: cation transporter [Chloroflexia bacterium]|nr:cation transporter [Chloroflexia bacterium]